MGRLNLAFDERPIGADSVLTQETRGRFASEAQANLWRRVPQGEDFEKVHPNNSQFNSYRLRKSLPARTLTSSAVVYFWDEPREPNGLGYCRLQTFPSDYDFLTESPKYVCGMSVPPFMMQRVSAQVAHQLFGAPMRELHNGPWNLSDLRDVEPNGLKVFSCFHCGGGSSMGYKLAGYDVIGGVEIDPKMMELYRRNVRPRLSYLMGVQEFRHLSDLPDELYDLDVLDGSPPCSSFSMAGSREKAWGKNKKFREGQAHQVLDDLFFEFIAIAKMLRPRVVIAENVKGLITGKARGYVKQIFAAFREAGYDCQLFLLNSSRMGVPQSRERTFFIATRDDCGMKKANLDFQESSPTILDAMTGLGPQQGKRPAPSYAKMWERVNYGGRSRDLGINKAFNFVRLDPRQPCPTLTSQPQHYLHWDECRLLSGAEITRVQSFPDDYDFMRQQPGYVCGMSVPPFMMERLSSEVARQILS
jgi:DNA (cytosine-5)-methyltransferase 1